jgi:hypothetical protein
MRIECGNEVETHPQVVFFSLSLSLSLSLSNSNSNSSTFLFFLMLSCLIWNLNDLALSWNMPALTEKKKPVEGGRE